MSEVLLKAFHKHINSETYDQKELIEETKNDIQYWETKINGRTMSGKYIGNFLNEIENIDSLKELTFEECYFLPKEIGTIKYIEELSINKCPNLDLKMALEILSNVEHINSIDFSQNYFISIPSDLSSIKSLKSIGFFEEYMKNLPVEINDVKTLTDIYIEDCPVFKVEEFIKTIQQNKQIVSLAICNSIDSIPEEIGKLTNLIELDLYNNCFTHIPNSIKSLKNLENLNFLGNNLSELNIKSGEFMKLKNINLGANKFETFPDELIHLSNIESIALWQNEIKTIPNDIVKLRELKKMYLRYNQISRKEQERIKKLIPNLNVDF